MTSFKQTFLVETGIEIIDQVVSILDFELKYKIFVSVVKQWIARKKRGKRGDEVKPRWEQDYELIPNEGLFGEYLEMG